MDMRKRVQSFIQAAGLFCLLVLCAGGCAKKDNPDRISVAIPESVHVQDPGNNYYINWLEEQTGLELDITVVRQRNGAEFLDALFSSDAEIDIVMFGEDFRITREELSHYVASGDISADEGRTFYENTGSARKAGVGQVLWINYSWLQTLSLPIPETTDELETVLTAFREMDPNGNGIRDEIPLAGAPSDYSFSPVEFLLNAYFYNDPYHSRFGINEEADVLYAASDELREGLTYCRGLYEKGLLDDGIWEGSHKLLAEMCNSMQDIVGAFTTESISDCIYQGNPEILARYIHVPPLQGPEGERNVLYTRHAPEIGAIITGRSAKKAQAKKLLSLMLTPEASLIARYGEEGVDWNYSVHVARD